MKLMSYGKGVESPYTWPMTGPSYHGVTTALPGDLLGVLDELLEADIGQRMLHELREHAERDGADVRAEQRGVDHVRRVAHRRDQHLGLEVVVVVDLHDLLDDVH